MLLQNISFTKGILRYVIINFQMYVCRNAGPLNSKHVTIVLFTLNC
jgi:hypothetical protein